MRRLAISRVRDCSEPLANAISSKLIEKKLVQTQTSRKFL